MVVTNHLNTFVSIVKSNQNYNPVSLAFKKRNMSDNGDNSKEVISYAI